MTIWRVKWDDGSTDTFFSDKKEAIAAVINKIMSFYDDLEVAMSEINDFTFNFDKNPDEFGCDTAKVSEVHVV